MTKSAKELAFLFDLYVDPEWTRRFADLIDGNFGFTDDRSLLYINAGTGNHVLEIGTKAGREAAIRATCASPELTVIAREKATATGSRVEFSDIPYEPDSFDAVIADGSLVAAEDLKMFIADASTFAETGGTVVIAAVASGSFGEVFSLLWEAMMDEPAESAALAERLISQLPTVSLIEEVCAESGLENVETKISNESFEFADGDAFVNSPLVSEFLMPMWFGDLEKKQIERIRERLARLIDEEDAGLSFRFSVKALIAIGEKA